MQKNVKYLHPVVIQDCIIKIKENIKINEWEL